MPFIVNIPVNLRAIVVKVSLSFIEKDGENEILLQLL